MTPTSPTSRCQGVNWYGSESETAIVEGLDRNSVEFYLTFLKQHNFNAVRLLFNHKAVRQNYPIPMARGTVDAKMNPQFFASTGHGAIMRAPAARASGAFEPPFSQANERKAPHVGHDALTQASHTSRC